MENDKKNQKLKPVNLKINTRIVITSILAIVIPLIIISIFSGMFITTLNKLISPVGKQNSYGIINQIQWEQTINSISSSLTKGDGEALEGLKKQVASLEEMGTSVYIEKNGSELYSSCDKENILQMINEIAPISTDADAYFFGKTGVVIVSHTAKDTDRFKIIIVNNLYTVPDINNKDATLTGALTNRTIIVISAVATTFVLAIIIISLITSKTIIGPIKKITRGANEIAKGNLDYEIDYHSTNELGQLADSFDEMRLRVKAEAEERQRANQKQKEIISGIAHDLRTPLTSVKGYAEGLKDGIADTPEKQERYLNTIYNSTCYMERLLNDLLTTSKFELGDITLNREDVSISDFIGYAEDIRYDISQYGFEFELYNNVKTNPIISIDTDRFARVIDNIVSNSVKYKRNDIKGKITFTVSEYEHSVIFELKDNGVGVDKESLPHIFDKLYRTDKARSNVSDGSGLGLAICKQIVELHGGMIWARSELGAGLTIFISLPIKSNNEK